ncbi:MAG: glucan 1,4-alpha-glucosidase, partial [Actinobacteria bacterium]|nr:glucan 1,4-alpha-glucosidase [Actinomycetota bacterium]
MHRNFHLVPCCCNKKLLTDILRDEWGFAGFVVSDCGGVRDIYTAHHYASSREEAVALAIDAGMDLNCGDQYEAYLLPAVQDGLVAEATVDRALFRVYSARFRLGDFDPPEMVQYTSIPMSVVDSPQHRELARQACRESIVLLKNDRNVLPLSKNKIKSIAVIGPNANVCQTGDYSGIYSKAVTPLEGLQNKFTKSKISFEKGCDITVSLPPIPSDELIPSHAKKGQHGLHGEYF